MKTQSPLFVHNTSTISNEKKAETYFPFNHYHNRNRRFVKKSNKMITSHNDNWMKDWMEQADNYKNNSEAMTLIGSNRERFLQYADSVEGEYA